MWVVDGGERIAEIDPRTSAVARKIDVDAESLAGLAVGAGAVWVTDPQGGTVTRIDPAQDPDDVVQRSIPLDQWVGGIAYGDRAVWATNEIADSVYRIDPDTNTAEVVDGMTAPRGIAVGEGATWVTTAGSPSADAALPASSCSDVYFGGEGEPDVLLVSDLPLRGESADFTRAMVEGIRFALERRGFAAGRYSVGYQSCDPSTAQGGVADEYRCMRNAKAYARNLDVIGVIGAWNSFCTYLQLPFANEAPDGPLAMISPANTWTGLTRPYPGWPPRHVEALYPSGERNYVRIAAANHLQAVAMMQLTKELGRSVSSSSATTNGTACRPTRARLREASGSASPGKLPGTTMRGTSTVSHGGSPARAQRRSRSSGLFEQNEGALISDLREALGPDVPLIAGDGFMPQEGLVRLAGPAAEGMYLALYGLPDDELPPTGKRFLEEFEATHGGPTPWYMATYGAQAVEILLDAIARSDGTRPSVNTELRRTMVENGILGDIRFDENGDLVEGPVTFFRAVGPREPSATEVVGSKGLAFDRVIMARAEALD